MQSKVLIVGGGLSGLALAWQLEQQGVDYQLIEARERLGGRIHSYQHEGAVFDLGPSWFWPGQPRIAKLVSELELTVFEQYAQGELMYEDQAGNVRSGFGYASMQGSYRLENGLIALIQAIQSKLPKLRYACNKRAICIEKQDDVIITRVEDVTESTVNIETIQSHKVILALPPRIASTLNYQPALDSKILSAMKAIPTWMAGHAKAIIIYKDCFWKSAGLSGDAMSHRGPLAEIHDASPYQTGPYALFGFVGVPARYRESNASQLKQAIVEQLVRLFGQAASQPIEVILQDWAFEKETAIQLDHNALNHHPNYGLTTELTNLWNDHLILSSTESAPQFGGYIEGALEAADLTFNKLNESRDA